jgi:serine/threonine-protein kinase
MDFGLAKLSDQMFISLDRLKGSDGIVASGTPEYIAPEQVRGDEIDHRSDLYSVGIILYELLTGRLPFSFENIERTLEAQRDSPVPSFASIGIRDVSREIEMLVMRCLCKFPVERPQNAWELVQLYEKALGKRFLPDEQPSTAPVEVAEPVIFHRKPVDQDAVVQQIEAWMPEPIAVVKLRGFVQDVRGEPLESVPGKIRVRLGGPQCVYQVPRGGGAATAPPPAKKGWFGLGGGSATGSVLSRGKCIDMELQLEKKKDARGNAILLITMMLRPEGGGPLPRNPDWHALCETIYKDLRGYVMGKA